jgi:uncharacterized protein with PQ loop repeat
MSFDTLITVSNVLQSSIVLVMLSAFVPQWITIHRNRSSQNISKTSWFMYFTASIFALFYAVVQYIATGSGQALVATTVVSFICNLYSVHLVYRFRTAEWDDADREGDAVAEGRLIQPKRGEAGYGVQKSLLGKAPRFSPPEWDFDFGESFTVH